MRFVEEDYGHSELARRFGVTRYPAIFVGDVLVATPNDFGFYPKEGGTGGRYASIDKAESQLKFRADLEQMLKLMLEHGRGCARAAASPAPDASLAEWPALALADLEGHAITRASLAGRPVIVEFWATWCPPCRATLRWLGELKRRYGEQLAVVAICIEPEPAAVQKLVGELGLPFHWVLGTPEIVRAFGDVSAVPTLHVFDAHGKCVQSHFGATPQLHERVEAALPDLLK
ncbi:MAG: TlpA family protein disulfide reductase [Planctomycetes bacterium]|nr:TlpA family protein disulfide reductase [Planctomycetota bacterium]